MKQNFLIGETPLLHLSRFFPGGQLYGKAECFHLTGSVKDRAALAMLTEARSGGLLPPNGTVIEATSGNMGISLAALAARMGYRCIIVMPENMSAERRQLMESYGARVVLTPEETGMRGAVEQAELLAAEHPGSFLPRQFENPINTLAHYRTTGAEIWLQREGDLQVLVAGVGTGGTLAGTARFLKEQDPGIRIVAVEPQESPLLSCGRVGSHGIQGIGAGFLPPLLDRALIDDIIPVTEAQAIAATRHLAKTEGLLCGISSGAALHAAAQLTRPGQRVVAILPDSGQRYLSCQLVSEILP